MERRNGTISHSALRRSASQVTLRNYNFHLGAPICADYPVNMAQLIRGDHNLSEQDVLQIAQKGIVDDEKNWFKKLLMWMIKYRSEWVQKMSAHFFAVAMMIVPVSIALVASPPGGLWQASVRPEDDPGCNKEFLEKVNRTHCHVASPCLLYSKYELFVEFQHYVVTCCVSTVTNLAAFFVTTVAGEEYKRIALQFMQGSMSLSIYCIVHAFINCVLLIMPDFALYPTWWWFLVALYASLVVLALFFVLTIIQMGAEVVRKCVKK